MYIKIIHQTDSDIDTYLLKSDQDHPDQIQIQIQIRSRSDPDAGLILIQIQIQIWIKKQILLKKRNRYSNKFSFKTDNTDKDTKTDIDG